MKDIFAFVGIEVLYDIIAKLTLDDIISIVVKVITLIFAAILFAVKYRKAKADDVITKEEREELKKDAKDILQFVVVGVDELGQIAKELKEEQEKKDGGEKK